MTRTHIVRFTILVWLLCPFELKCFFFGEYLICLNVADAILSIFSIVIAEQPKQGCSDRDGGAPVGVLLPAKGRRHT